MKSEMLTTKYYRAILPNKGKGSQGKFWTLSIRGAVKNVLADFVR